MVPIRMGENLFVLMLTMRCTAAADTQSGQHDVELISLVNILFAVDNSDNSTVKIYRKWKSLCFEIATKTNRMS